MEEAIEILKQFKEDCRLGKVLYGGFSEREEAIEKLLTGYKEERDLRIHYENRLDNMEQLYVDKEKIKEKIEARENSIADIKDNFVINEGMTIEIKRLETEIDVLQELLEEES